MWIDGRKNLFKSIESQLKPNEKRILIHAASLGEFEQGRPVIEEIKRVAPEYKIVLTFFSPSGFEIRKNYEFADYVFYLPLDTWKNANKFIGLIQPETAIFVKYEFWNNILTALKSKKIPTYLISAIFRKNQLFFKWYGGWFRKMLDYFEWFFVQNNESVELLKSTGFENVTLSGDTRFDRVFEIAQKVKSIPIVEKFKDGKFTIIVGSSWKADEEILFEYINRKNSDVKWILAPHEIHKQNIERIVKNLEKPFVCFSQANETEANAKEILVIDNIGMLSSIYQYGNIAYIGGGFGSGIHNILEAATFGMPVIFGPNYVKFQEAIDLIDKGGAFTVNNEKTLNSILDQLVNNKEFCTDKGAICRKYVDDNRGATLKIIKSVFKERQNHLV
ncbi:MAG: glycosyltransferase N-terminal domain-containing protein [Bacteroidales bacterium]